MDTGTGHVVRIHLRGEHPHDHLGVLLLLTRLGAILAIAGDVENGSQLILQPQGLSNQLLAASEVLHRGDHRKGFLTTEQGLTGMDGLTHAVLLMDQ